MSEAPTLLTLTVAVIVVCVPVATLASVVASRSVAGTLVQPEYQGLPPTAASHAVFATLLSALLQRLDPFASKLAGGAGTSPEKPLPPTEKFCSLPRPVRLGNVPLRRLFDTVIDSNWVSPASGGIEPES
ncbi:MAG: hypothetical protein E6K53_11780 [Gammaproteobacteria bacterium]|nr:MAG: hypothetical protein E6K53_11780 [Gammaproteobacteria bacterium]